MKSAQATSVSVDNEIECPSSTFMTTGIITPDLNLSPATTYTTTTITTTTTTTSSITQSTTALLNESCCSLDGVLIRPRHASLPPDYTFEWPSKLNCISAQQLLNSSNTQDWPYSHRRLKQIWSLNYQEAAIYLQEGANNEKHAKHPSNHVQMHFYHLVHNSFYRSLDLFCAIGLILITALENPGYVLPHIRHNVRVSLETFLLIISTLLLWLKFRWLGGEMFFSHRRSTLKAIALLVMLIEVAFMFARQKVHLRPWRGLRILFLVDCGHFDSTRRSFRHFLTSLPAVYHVIATMLLLLVNFAVLGHYLFPNEVKFATLESAFYHLLYCIGGSNFMDMLMPLYSKCRLTALYFISFMVIEVYFLFNVLLALIYHSFYQEEEKKLDNLESHWRRCCVNAFQLLTTAGRPKHLHFAQFRCVMKHLQPQPDELRLYLQFKLLDRDHNGCITLDEFHGLYELRQLHYEQLHPTPDWLLNGSPLKRMLRYLNRIFCCCIPDSVKPSLSTLHTAGRLFLRLELAAAFIVELLHASNRIWPPTDAGHFRRPLLIIYTLELLFKLLFAHNVTDFLRRKWNIFDSIVVIMATVFEYGGQTMEQRRFAFMHVLRALRFLTLFSGIKKFNDLIGAMLKPLLKELLHVAFFIFCVLYIFAVLGVELFSDLNQFQPAPSSSSSPSSTSSIIGSVSSSSSSSYAKARLEGTQLLLNSFQDFMNSFLTLFFLMCGSSWFYLSEHYVRIFGPPARLYFILFFLFTVLLTNIVMCVLIEFIIFQIRYRSELKQQGQEPSCGSVRQIAVSLQELRNHNLVQHISGLSPASSQRVHYDSNTNVIQTDFEPNSSSTNRRTSSRTLDQRFVIFRCWPEMDKFALFRLIKNYSPK